jgi:YHS domain-containing protein
MLNKLKSAVAIAAALTTFLMSHAAFAVDEYNTATGLTASGAPLGLHGVDPVSFIDVQNRIAGTAKYTIVDDGVAYYFSSQENADKFKKSPSKYQPQNGGFCTFGVSVGKKFDGSPQFADIVDGKLYVFLNESIYKEYLKDRKGTIRKAEKAWKKIRHVAASEL